MKYFWIIWKIPRLSKKNSEWCGQFPVGLENFWIVWKIPDGLERFWMVWKVSLRIVHWGRKIMAPYIAGNVTKTTHILLTWA